MHNAARRLEARSVSEEVGEVVRVDPASISVRTALAIVHARRAVSCLVEPARGDRVLLASEEQGPSFVLAVLERADGAGAATRISVAGDLELSTPRGKVAITTQDGLELASAAPVRVTAPTVDVSAIEGRLGFQVLDLFASTFRVELDKVKAIASKVDAVLDRLRLRARSSLRTVEELDQVRARHIDYAARGNAHFRGENTLVTAEDLVKVNADQVHLG
jgi:hypothetical protein